MNCKIFFVLAVLLIISSKGNALKCQVCTDKTGKNCVGTSKTCPSGTKFCYSASYTQSDGIKVVARDCDNRKFCPNAAETCKKQTAAAGLKSCSGRCCKTDNCNTYDYSSGRGGVLKCQQCRYDTSQPIAQQECVGTMVDCMSGYCYSTSYTQSDGTKVFKRDCDNSNFCPNAAQTCQRETQIFDLKSCAGMCCNTDYCNIPNRGRGCATKCQQCRYDSSQPKAQQKCAGTTVDCLSGYCYSTSYTQSDGIKVVERDCDNRKFCPNAAETCRKETQIFGLKSCTGTCCTTDNCNDSGTSSIVAAKFSICFLVILGYFLA